MENSTESAEVFEEAIEGDSLAMELEAALSGLCLPSTLQSILKGRAVPDKLRRETWSACLQLHKYGRENLADIFDLSEQAMIRSDCKEIVEEKLSNEEDVDKLSIQSDLESVITTYCKETGVRYDSECRLLELLTPFLPLGFKRKQLLSVLLALHDNFIPRDNAKNGRIYHVFRLLVLYHEPELCSFLDTRQIFPDVYAASWFRSLFAASCPDVQVIQRIWDIYFSQSDPFFLTFLALVILVNAKEQLLQMKSDGREAIVAMLESIPGQLSVEDVADFCSIANFYASKTPTSYWREFNYLFDHDQSLEEREEAAVEVNPFQALCMPVSISELLAQHLDGLRFFLVDCRPPEQYNAGHLPTAFHLNAKSMVSEPQSFETAVSALLLAQTQAIEAGNQAGGEHLCFLGSGRDEEDQFVHMVVSNFLRRQQALVSCVVGGYEALHEALLDELPGALTDHDTEVCIPCQGQHLTGEATNQSRPTHPSAAASLKAVGSDGGKSGSGLFPSSRSKSLPSTSGSFLEKISLQMKQKSSEMKEKLIEIITNPQVVEMEQQLAARAAGHVVSSKGKSRVVHPPENVFRIAGDTSSDDEVNEEDAPMFQEMKKLAESDYTTLESWLKRSDSLGHFECQEVKPDGKVYDSVLLVCRSHLFILRRIPGRKGVVTESVRRSHGSVVRITSKRKHPELLTIKYGVPREMDDEFVITDVDRMIVPRAFEATRLIKQEVMRISEEKQRVTLEAVGEGDDEVAAPAQTLAVPDT